jgi:hypothetical protein
MLLPQLVSFVIDNLICRICWRVSAKPEIEIKTFGFTTGRNYLCNYGVHICMQPDLLRFSSQGQIRKGRSREAPRTEC